MMVAGGILATYGGGASLQSIAAGSPIESILDKLGIGLIPNDVQAGMSEHKLAETLGVSAQELGLIGMSLIVGGGMGIAARQALKTIETLRSEYAEGTPESRQASRETLRLVLSDTLSKIGPEAQGKLIESLDAAGILREVFVVGSILPDEV